MLTHGLTTLGRSEQWLNELGADTSACGDHQVQWPLLVGCWKHKPSEET